MRQDQPTNQAQTTEGLGKLPGAKSSFASLTSSVTDKKDYPSYKPHESIEIQENGRNPKSFIEKANFLSFLHFGFALRIILLARFLKKRVLRADDLNSVGYNDSCEKLEPLFTSNYYEYRKKYPNKKRVMIFTLLTIFKKDVFIQLFWQFLFAASRILIAYFLNKVLIVVRNPKAPPHRAYGWAVGMFLMFILGLYSNHHFSFNSSMIVNRMKIGILGMMFRKINKLSLYAVHRMNLGKVINIVANDTNNLERVHFTVSLVLAPFILAGGLGLLYSFWGPSSFVGVGYMAVTWIMQRRIAERTVPIRRAKSMNTDTRLKFMHETLEAIRLIKVYVWERPTIEVIEKFRTQEANCLKKFNFLDSISRSVVFSSNVIGSFLIFAVYSHFKDDINPARIFPTILLMTFLRQLCMINTFNCFTFFAEMRLLFMRVMSIMDLKEVEAHGTPQSPLNPENSIEFQDFTGYWVSRDLDIEAPLPPMTPEVLSNTKLDESVSSSYHPGLSHINLEIKKGTLVAVVGKVGSGKSSLLLSFTGEMAMTFGSLNYGGTYAYVAQEPVIFSGSLKDSILFGKPFDEELFWKVIEACCLADDIRNWPNKELTEIGERGVNLSGGQKAQLVLARALYSQADIYLLDNPLSWLGTKLSKKIFKKAIQEFLQDKTVIMVTHQLHLAKHANQIVVMEEGRIATHGVYEEIAKTEIYIDTLTDFRESIKTESEKAPKHGFARPASELYQPFGRMDTIGEVRDERVEQEEQNLISSGRDEGLFIENERLDDGRATMKIYWKYLRSILTWYTILPLAFLFTAAESIAWLFMIFMGKWGRNEWSNSKAYKVLAPLVVGCLFLHLFKFLLYFNSTLNASTKYHNKMLKGIMQSPVKFFDRNPLGRILNRFSNDVGILDKFLIASLLDVLEGFCNFMVFLVALWVTEPWILVPAAVVTIFYILIVILCKSAINQTRGLELTTRGPLYSLFSIAVSGLISIRARNQLEDVMKDFYRKANDQSKANIAYQVSIRFMSFFMDYVTELTVIGTFCFFIRAKDSPLVSGFFVNMLVLMPTTMQWILRNFIVLHSLMASAARVINYCENYRGVDLAKLDDDKYRQMGWPTKGEIEIKNACLKYKDDEDFAIKGLSVHIEPGEKVAVMGCYKSGMSSLVHMLLRTFDIDDRLQESFIKIDGVNIKDVGLHLLRNSIATMPQNPYLFTATIRENLDPWKNFTDEELWAVLEDVGLKDFVDGLKKKMDTMVSKGASLFSIGQKQLICVARALLKKSNIVIQDDATVHVDINTDEYVQKKILEKFKHATVLTLTHRLWNIANYDKVLVIDNGIKVEFNEPYRLLVKEIGDREITNKKGHFASTVLNLGPKVSHQIFRNAMKKYALKHHIPLHFEEPIGTLSDLHDHHSSEKSTEIETAQSLGLREEEVALEVDKENFIQNGKNGERKGRRNSTKNLKPFDRIMLGEMSPNLLHKIVPRQFRRSSIGASSQSSAPDHN